MVFFNINGFCSAIYLIFFFIVPLVQAILHRQVSGRALVLMALLGQLTFTLYYWLQYIGIAQTNASISAILGVGLIPLFTTLLAPVVGQERWNPQLVALLLLGFCGVVLIIFQRPLMDQDGYINIVGRI
jgi:drug/metabolite transporter (DMT)-like permease